MVTSDRDLFSKLALAASMGISETAGVYLDDYAQIHQRSGLTQSTLGISTSDVASALQMLSVAVVLNDLSFLTLTGGEDHLINALTSQGIKLYFGERDIQIVLPNEAVKNTLINSKAAYLGFMYRNDEPATELLRNISPLIERRRVVYTPERMLIYKKSDNDDGTVTWDSLMVEEGLSDYWKAKDEVNTIIGMSADPSDNRHYNELCELAVPFLTGVNFSDLAKILDDERDLLIEFRSELQKIVDAACAGKRTSLEVINDVINPRIHKIERRFRTISNAARLKLGGAAIGVATLSLASYMSSGLLAMLVATIGGSGGAAAYMAKEYAGFLIDREGLKDDPIYLLWRLRRIGSKY